MKTFTTTLITLGILLWGMPVSADSIGDNHVQHIVWDNTPIRLSLPIGKEIRIDFPVPVDIEAPREVVAKTDRLTIRENGSVYWTVNAAFTVQRITVKTSTGHTYLMDISASNDATGYPVEIVDDRFNSAKEGAEKETGGNTYGNPTIDDITLDYHHLARYVFQELFSPPRLIAKLPGVVRIPVSRHPVPLFRGGSLDTTPIIQFQTSTIPTLYVTALDVRNQSMKVNQLDPTLLRGRKLASVPYHKYVMPKGQNGDWSVWVVITERPFEEVMP